MRTSSTKARILLALGTGITVSLIGLTGLLSHLSYLLYPGMYPFRNVTEGLGKLALILALPLNVLFFSAITFAIASLGARQQYTEAP